jgi:hypothetical protein
VNDQSRRERYKVTFERAPATPPVATPKVPPKSPERTAWDNAYASEQGPVGGSWPDDGRHIPYMRWVMPVHIPTHPGTLRNFRRFS